MDWRSWTDWLTLVGGALQCAGLILAVREIIRAENRNFPERRNRVLRVWQRVTRPWRKTYQVGKSVQLGAAVESNAALSLKVQREPIDPDDLKKRLNRLEAVIADHDREHRAAIEDLRAETRAETQLLGQRIANLANDFNAARQEEREGLRDSLTMQWIYTTLFVLGTVLATTGSLYG